MSIPNVQLAFQGGGAKFAVMLPVADAFLTVQRRRQVNIKAVAGTSSGSLCAALVATGADFNKVRSILKVQGAQWVSRLIPPDVKPLAEREKSLAWWEWFAHRKLLQKVLWDGDPVLNMVALSDFFKALFDTALDRNASRLQIEDCKSKLTIIASNIAASKAVIHQSGELLPALADSCALPIILRSFKSLARTHHVDGGLCDDLPVEGLLADVEAPVFAIYPVTPASEGEVKNNIVTYLLALLSASINHATLRSQAMISEPFRFELDTDLGLLQFNRAIEYITDDTWYERQKEDALWRIQNFLNSYGVVTTPSAARVVDVVDVGQYRKSLMDLTSGFEHQFEYQLSSFTVRVNCEEVFLEQNEAQRREADTVTRMMKVKVIADDVRFYRSNLTVANHSIVPTVWTVRNLTREADVPIRALALEDRPHKGKTFKHCLIQFIDPELHLEKGDVLEIKGTYPSAVGNDLSKLNFKQTDYFGFTNAQNPAIAKADLILIHPRSLGDLRLFSDATRSDRRDETAIAFSDEYRQALDPKLSVVGMTVNMLAPEQAFFATVVNSA